MDLDYIHTKGMVIDKSVNEFSYFNVSFLKFRSKAWLFLRYNKGINVGSEE